MCWVLDNAFSIHPITASFFHDQCLYVGNDDFCIRIWNTLNSNLHRVLQGHTSTITGFAYADKYNLLFSVGIDGNLLLWRNYKCIYKYTHFKPPNNRFPAAIYSIYFSNDLDIIVLGLDSEIATFELSSKMIDVCSDDSDICPFTLRQTCKMHSDRIHLLAGGRRWIYTASFDRTVCSATLLDITIKKQISKHQTAVSTMSFDTLTQNLIVGDTSGVIRTFSADGMSLGPVAEGLEGSVTSLFYDQSLRLLWFVLSNGTIDIIDISHSNSFLGDHFQIFKDLPHAGSDSTSFERVLGNGFNNRVCALVNHKYIYTWKWSEFTYCFKLDMPNKPVTKIFAFNYIDEEQFFPTKKHQSRRTMELNTYNAKINSSLVNPGLNLFIGGSKVIASRPLSEFLYKNDDIFTDGGCSALDFIFAESSIFIGYKTGKVTLVSLASPLILMEEHGNDVSITSIVSLQSFAFTIADDMSMIMWNTHEVLELIKKRDRIHDHYITCAAACDNRNLFITCDEAGFCRLWHIEDERLSSRTNSTYSTHASSSTSRSSGSKSMAPAVTVKEELLLDHSAYGAISHVCYSKCSDFWIFATQDGYIRAYSVSQPLTAPTFSYMVLPCHVTALAAGLNSDVYFATEDKVIRLISMNTDPPEELGIYNGHTDIITQIFIPPSYSAKRWVSLQWNGEVYFWSFRSYDVSRATSNLNLHTKSKRITDKSGKWNDLEESSRLPLLYKKSGKDSQNKSRSTSAPLGITAQTSMPSSAAAEKEKPISFYDKARKTLLLKRRDEERQMKIKKKSHTWKMLVSMSQQMENAMNIYEAEKLKKQNIPCSTPTKK